MSLADTNIVNRIGNTELPQYHMSVKNIEEQTPNTLGWVFPCDVITSNFRIEPQAKSM